MTHIRPRPSLLLGLVAGAALSAAVVAHEAELHVVDGDTVDWGCGCA